VTTSLPDAVGLLRDLVRTPSPSGEEARGAEVLAAWAMGAGLDPIVDDAAVRIEVPGAESGPTLLFASHLDTVPPGEGWARDPYGAEIESGFLHGRGAVDAKGSVAAMTSAAAALVREGFPRRGRLIVLATYREETLHTSMPLALARSARPDAAIVGEPTRLAPCVAQRGLIVLRLHWRGTPRHAGWAAEGPQDRDNAVEKAASDLAALAGLSFDRTHPVLGRVSLVPTRIEGGSANNVVPERCTAVLDIRTTPVYATEEIVAAVRAKVSAEVEVASARCLPCETPPGSRLLAAIRAVRPDAEPFGSPTASDWVSLRDTDAVKLGPGDSRLSHTNEERVAVDEIAAAAVLYAAIAKEYLHG
jgi:acetylornithine deacetylase